MSINSNKVMLITYPNSLGKNLIELQTAVHKLGDSIGGVHIFPPYPSSSDRGFAPLTHLEISPEFGNWQDVKNLRNDLGTVCLDLILNHISSHSKEFKDYQENGENSIYKDLFININRDKKEFLKNPKNQQLLMRPRPISPFQEYLVAGADALMWVTFSRDQIDLNFDNQITLNLINSWLEKLAQNKINLIRLDAFPYVKKTAGTNCFMSEESWEVVDKLNNQAKELGINLLPEVHGSYTLQLEIAKRGYWVYDFALPMLVLKTIFSQDATELIKWLSICPYNQYTTLDTHDGIGIVDVVGLLSQVDIDKTVETIMNQGGNLAKKASGTNSDNLDIYQVNTTYYSALGEDDNKYLLARAIQLFTPGIPQIYYVGLFAGVNDEKLLDETKNGRDINRHNYTLDELDSEVKRPVVSKLLEMCKLRNEHPAFNGQFKTIVIDQS